jgi:hypothetical protein
MKRLCSAFMTGCHEGSREDAELKALVEAICEVQAHDDAWR